MWAPTRHSDTRLFTRLRRTGELYLAIVAILGLGLVFIVPPFQSPDEQTHLYRAYQLSSGHVIASHLSYGAGGVLPKSLSESFESYRYLLFKPDEKLNIASFKASLRMPLNKNNVVETRFENTAPYAPVTYAPQAIGIFIGKLFSAGPILLLYLARLCNLILWIGVMWLIIRRNRRLLMPVVAIALVPIVAFQASSASADVTSASLSLLFICEVLGLVISKKHATKKQILLLGVLGLLLALCKLPYVGVAGALLAVPAKQINYGRIRGDLVKLAVITAAGVAAILWYLLSKDSFVNLRYGVNESKQIHLIFGSPIDYMHTLYSTFVTSAGDVFIQMTGYLGWFDAKMPTWAIFAALFALALSFVTVPLATSESIGTRIRVFALGLWALLALTIASILYITWDTPGAALIEGVQARYFTPLIGLLLVAFAGLIQVTQSGYIQTKAIIACLCTGSTLAMLVTLFSRYY